MLKLSLQLGSLMIFSALCSCVSAPPTWSEGQKAALSSVAIENPVTERGAYTDPVGNEEAEAPLLIVGGGSFAAGAAVNAGAQLIAEGIIEAQSSDFEEKYGASFGQIRSITPNDVGASISNALKKRLNQHSFFRSRLSSSSPNGISLKITRYGLVRCGKRDGEVLVSPSIYGTWKLSASGKILAEGRIAAASPLEQRTVTEFAASPLSLRKGYAEAADRAAQAIVSNLDDKLGSVWNLDRGKEPVPERSGYAKASGGPPERLADFKGPQEVKAMYAFERNFNAFTVRPTQAYTISDHKLLIASTANGGVILVMAKPGLVTGSKIALGDASYHAVRVALEQGGVRIAQQRALKYFGANVGYILELTGDGEAELASFKS
ncbi:hypothetical protein [Haloferula sp.]|uniref:hypothetical protein n=1 Tax=Haloferula sp. TaxID=2497595 RepID=UPI003C72D209